MQFLSGVIHMQFLSEVIHMRQTESTMQARGAFLLQRTKIATKVVRFIESKHGARAGALMQ